MKPTKEEISKIMSYIGSIKSDAKTKSSRENGKKGGYPKGRKRKKILPLCPNDEAA
jgi:hypothetical protein